MKVSIAGGALVSAVLLGGSFARAAAASRITADIDPRIELAGAAQALGPAAGDPKGFIRPAIPYARALEATSASGRPAAALDLKEFSFSDRCQVLLRLSGLPALAERLTMPYAFYDRAGGRDRFEAWLRSLRSYARDAGFLDRFASAKSLLAPRVEAFRRKLEQRDFVGKIEAYTGLPLTGSYSVFLSPYVGEGDNANLVEPLDDGTIEISSVFGPQIAPDPESDFWSVRTPGTLWHEAGHGIEDPLGDLFADSIAASSAAYRTSWGCYGDWPQCVKEEVVRAVMIRLVAAEFGEAAAAEQLAFENEKRFPQLKPMVESLKAYEKSRESYPTLADYYPRLLETLPGAGSRPRPADFSALAGRLDCAPVAKSSRMKLYLEHLLARAKDPDLLAAVRAAQAAASVSDAAGHRCRGR